MENDNQLLTGKEVSEQAKISSRTLIRLRQRGEIKFVKIGRSIRYPREVLLAHQGAR
jgi:excisionase family DNA binding protein